MMTVGFKAATVLIASAVAVTAVASTALAVPASMLVDKRRCFVVFEG